MRDDFEASVIDPVLWKNDGAAMPNTGVLTITPSTVGQFEGLSSVVRYDYRSRWIAVELVAVPPAGSSGGVGFQLRYPAENDYPYLFVDNGMLIGDVQTPTSTVPVLMTPFDPVAHRFVRMRALGGNLVWEVSGDGHTWTKLAQRGSVSFINDATLRVVAYDNAAPLDVTATVDQLVVCAD